MVFDPKMRENKLSHGLKSSKRACTDHIQNARLLISRQRYWGAPIPMVHVEGYQPIAVADSCLPVILPEVEDFKPTGGNTSVLAQVDEWVRVWVHVETGETVEITKPKPEGEHWVEGRRETDTLDGYACSSWYYIRYIDPFNTE